MEMYLGLLHRKPGLCPALRTIQEYLSILITNTVSPYLVLAIKISNIYDMVWMGVYYLEFSGTGDGLVCRFLVLCFFQLERSSRVHYLHVRGL